MTDDIRTIEARHTQDDVWFRAGHHDPNGYVAMAHKDRGALLERGRRPPPESMKFRNLFKHTPGPIDDADILTVTRALMPHLLDEHAPEFDARALLISKLLSRIHAEKAGHAPPQIIVNPMVAVPKAAWDWLMGEGPDDHGNHFEEPCTRDGTYGSAVPVPKYWWRTTFRRMCGEKS